MRLHQTIPFLMLACAVAAVGCRKAAVIHPLAAEHNIYCTRYLEEGLLDKAQHRCELALEYNQDFAEPHNNLCLVSIKRGELEAAKKQCIKALRLRNDFAEAYNNLGYIYLQERAYGKAHDAFVNALKINPGYIEARYNLCLTLLHLEKNTEARVCYDKVIEVNSAVADPFHDLCVLDIRDAEFDKAIAHCSHAVELDPRYEAAWFHLGRALQGAGRHCDAQEAYKECIAIDDKHAECRNNLSSAARHCALASPHLDEIKEMADSDASPMTLYRLGVAEKQKGLLTEAERHFERCLKLDGRFGPCHCHLAEMARRISNDDEVVTLCRKCLRYTQPTDEEILPERDLCQRLIDDQTDE